MGRSDPAAASPARGAPGADRGGAPASRGLTLPASMAYATSRPRTKNNFLQGQRQRLRKQSLHRPQEAPVMKIRQPQAPCAQEEVQGGPKTTASQQSV